MRALQMSPLAALLVAGCAVSGQQPSPGSPPLPSEPAPSEPAPVEPAPITEDRAESSEEPHSSEFPAHAVNFFLGGASEIGDLDGITFGLDYAYRLSPRWSAGAFAEAITGLDRSFATGLQGYFHATHELILMAGPGMEQAEHGWGPFARFGAAYEFEIAEQWVLAPAVFYDFTERENVLVYGLNVGYLW